MENAGLVIKSGNLEIISILPMMHQKDVKVASVITAHVIHAFKGGSDESYTNRSRQEDGHRGRV